MNEIVTQQLLPILTVIGQVYILWMLLVVGGVVKSDKTVKFIKEYGLSVGIVVSLVAIVGSLFYSEVMGYNPCKLCWYQRILMYPQVILLGLALRRKDLGIAYYIYWLSNVGIVFALYHYLLQLGLLPSVLCQVGGTCAARFVFQFGYITIPMMALTAFVMISLTMRVLLKTKAK